METTRPGPAGGTQGGADGGPAARRFDGPRAVVVVVVAAVVVGVAAQAPWPFASPDAPAPVGLVGGRAWLDGRKLDLNAVDAGTLARISGIGPSLAQRIVDERARRGRFGDVEELDEVEGIGPKLLQKLSALVEVR